MLGVLTHLKFIIVLRNICILLSSYKLFFCKLPVTNLEEKEKKNDNQKFGNSRGSLIYNPHEKRKRVVNTL